MPKTFSQALLWSLLLLGLSVSAHSQESIKVSGAWARSTFEFAKSAAVYLEVENDSLAAEQLVGVRVEPSVAQKAELHESTLEKGIAKMRRLDLPFTISAKAKLSLTPGGKHLMLFGLKKPLQAEMHFPLWLSFANQEEVRILVSVKSADQGQEQGHAHHH